MEERIRELEIVVAQLARERAELKGYVSGRLDSVAHDLQVQAEELRRQMAEFRHVFYGEDGTSEGVPEQLRHVRRAVRWMAGLGTVAVGAVAVELVRRLLA